MPIRNPLAQTFALAFTLLSAVPSCVTAHAQSRNSLPVPYPALGVAQGTLPILHGWRGEAPIDRTSDPLSYANRHPDRRPPQS